MDVGNIHGDQGGRQGGINWEFETNTYTLLIYKIGN